MKQNLSMSVTQKQQNVHTACTNSLYRAQAFKTIEGMSELRNFLLLLSGFLVSQQYS